MLRSLLLLALVGCGGGTDTDTDEDSDVREPTPVRFATFNVSLFGSASGQVASNLGRPSFAAAQTLAAIVQEVRPDVLLLNELDWDADGLAVERLKTSYLEVSQGGREPIVYDHVYLPEVNTGVPSGVDLNNDGAVGGAVGSRAYGEDSFGYGEYPGQYGMVVLSRYPIRTEEIRTFQRFLWADVPFSLLPRHWYSEEAIAVLRLSSKTHADVPIDIEGHVVHFLVSHPTPPSFDGDEDRNGKRNHDEIRLWLDYIDGGPTSWHVDDDGGVGGLTDESFVIAGDLNNDPNDGDSLGEVIVSLLEHPRVAAEPAPRSEGGAEQAMLLGGRNASHTGDPALDTAAFNSNTVGNLRVDYVLPSSDLPVREAGVFWPLAEDPLFDLVGTFPFPLSDHRLVWVDVDVP